MYEQERARVNLAHVRALRAPENRCTYSVHDSNSNNNTKHIHPSFCVSRPAGQQRRVAFLRSERRPPDTDEHYMLRLLRLLANADCER